MSLLEQIKLATLELRKAKHPLAALGQTVIGEAEMIGKNDGNRPVTDTEVMSRVKKFLTGVDDTIKLVKHPDALAGLHAEKAWLEGWLPKQMDRDQLTATMQAIVIGLKQAQVAKIDVGAVMKELKARFDGQYDGKMAASVAKEILT
jgi:uncharacterized protein YqeY